MQTAISPAVEVYPQPKGQSYTTFVIIHNHIYDILDTVSAQAERLYRILRQYSDARYKKCFPKTKTLAAKMDVSQDSITRYLKELVNAGLIEIKQHQRFNRNEYHFLSQTEFRIQNSGTSSDTYPKEKNVEFLNAIPDNSEPIKKSTCKSADTLERVSVPMQDKYPHGCRYNNNINSDLNSNSTTNKLTPPETTNTKPSPKSTQKDVVVDSTPLQEIIQKHQLLQTQLKAIPNPDTGINDSFRRRRLDSIYGEDLVSMILQYTSWCQTTQKTNIKSQPAFITWALKHPEEIDFTEYFKHLEHLIKKQSRKEQPKCPSLEDTILQLQQEYHKLKESIIRDYQHKQPDDYNAIKQQLEEQQKKSPICNKPGTVAFISMVEHKLFNAICQKQNLDVPMDFEEYQKSQLC